MKPNLRNFINDENERRKIFKDKLATAPTCLNDSKWIIDRLESSLSPESLDEDGEIEPEEVRQKEQYFLAVHSELEEFINLKIELEY